MSATLAIVLALICLAAGGLLGFLAGRGGASSETKRADALEEEFADYRRNVTEHFGETAEHFRNIGRQYRDLYEHMASGADALCNEDERARLAFPSLRAIEGVAATTVAGAAAAAGSAATEADDAAAPTAAATTEAAEPDQHTDAVVDENAVPQAADTDADATAPEDTAGAEDAIQVEVEVIDDEATETAAVTADDDGDETGAASEGEDSEADNSVDDNANADPEALRKAGAT